MIEITVALPMFRAKYIGWLALEGLSRQINAPAWELIVDEEFDDQFSPFGHENIMTYKKRLKQANCKDINYMARKDWVPLSYKWCDISQMSKGEIYMLQAADCFAHPHRLRDTFDLMTKNKADWYTARYGIFYEILYDKAVKFVTATERKYGLNFALKNSLLKKVEQEDKRHYVDWWLFHKAEEIKGSPLDVIWDESVDNDHWKYGFDTNGINNISDRRQRILNCDNQFQEEINIDSSIPEDILKRLRNLKDYCHMKEDYRPWEEGKWVV